MHFGIDTFPRKHMCNGNGVCTLLIRHVNLITYDSTEGIRFYTLLIKLRNEYVASILPEYLERNGQDNCIKQCLFVNLKYRSIGEM